MFRPVIEGTGARSNWGKRGFKVGGSALVTLGVVVYERRKKPSTRQKYLFIKKYRRIILIRRKVENFEYQRSSK